jgi:tetratricopeptide (TPR) repeat protein
MSAGQRFGEKIGSMTVAEHTDVEERLKIARAGIISEPHLWQSFTKLVAVLDELTDQYNNSGRLAEALSLTAESVEFCRHAAQLAPDDVGVQCLVPLGLTRLADAHVRANDRSKAAYISKECLRSLRSLKEKFPREFLIQQCLISAIERTAKFDKRAGDISAANAGFQEACETARACADRSDATDGDRRRLAAMLIVAGEHFEQQSDLPTARELLEEALTLAHCRVADNKEVDLRADVTYATLPLIRVLNEARDYVSALRCNKQALPIARECLVLSPDRVPRKKRVAELLIERGKSLHGMREHDLSRDNFNEAVEILRTAVAEQPGYTELLDVLAEAMAGLFDAMAPDGMFSEAAIVCRECVSITKSLLEREPNSVRQQDLLAGRLFSLMFFEDRVGNRKSAQTAAEERLFIETKLAASTPSPSGLLKLADALWFAAGYRTGAEREAPLRQVFTLLKSLEPTGLLSATHRQWLQSLQPTLRSASPTSVLDGAHPHSSADALVVCSRWNEPDHFSDDIKGSCSVCNNAIRFRPQIAFDANKVCQLCFQSMPF